jgi:serine/threonine protein kinase
VTTSPDSGSMPCPDFSDIEQSSPEVNLWARSPSTQQQKQSTTGRSPVCPPTPLRKGKALTSARRAAEVQVPTVLANTWPASQLPVSLADLRTVRVLSEVEFRVKVSVVQLLKDFQANPATAAIFALKAEPLSKVFKACSLEQLRWIKQRLSALWTTTGIAPPASLVRVHQVWIEDDRLFTLMDYCHGGSLLDALAPAEAPASAASSTTTTQPAFTLAQAMCVLQQVGPALHCLHSQRLLHNDVTPRNIGVDQSGGYRLIDLDSVTSFAENSAFRSTDEMDGMYMSFEAMQDSKNTSPASDVFALGHTLINLLRGRALKLYTIAEDVYSETIYTDLLSVLGGKLSDTEAYVVRLVIAMVAHDPAKRPSFAAIQMALAQVAAIEKGGVRVLA